VGGTNSLGIDVNILLARLLLSRGVRNPQVSTQLHSSRLPLWFAV
jgi:hypothetical protein